MTIQEANERLIPLVRQSGFKAYLNGMYISANPHKQGSVDDANFVFVTAWEDGWNAAKKSHLAYRE